MAQSQHCNDDNADNVIIDDACGLNSLMDNFNVKTYDLWKGNVTTKWEMLTKGVRSGCGCDQILILRVQVRSHGVLSPKSQFA